MNQLKYISGILMLAISCAIVAGVTERGIDTQGAVGLAPLLAYWGGMLSWQAQKEN